MIRNKLAFLIGLGALVLSPVWMFLELTTYTIATASIFFIVAMYTVANSIEIDA